MPDQQTFRADVLAALGASPEQVEELLRYNLDGYTAAGLEFRPAFPLDDEPFVSAWKHYARKVDRAGTVSVLGRYLVQLRFPIQEGISGVEEYVDATRRGNVSKTLPVFGLELAAPKQCTIEIYPTPAGAIPLLIVGARKDFESLVRALTCRNEPVPVPPSQGACMVAGYNNWHRFRLAERGFNGHGPFTAESRSQAIGQLREHKDLYQDRFIILSDGPYSGVPASELQLEEGEWRRRSLILRRDHEAAHYFTRRVLGCMRNNLRDELIADYMGIVAARGSYSEDWFLRFLGIHADNGEGKGRRFLNYRGTPPLSGGAMLILQTLVKRAARNLEVFDRRFDHILRQPHMKPYTILAISALTLEEIASDTGDSLLADSFLQYAPQGAAAS